jgi:hypothetical protein
MRVFTPIAIFALAKEGDAQLSPGMYTTTLSEADKKLASEHCEAKLKCLETFSDIHGARFRAGTAFPAVKLVIFAPAVQKTVLGPSRRGTQARVKEQLE